MRSSNMLYHASCAGIRFLGQGMKLPTSSHFTLKLLWRLRKQALATSVSRWRLCRRTDIESRASGLKTLRMSILKVNLLRISPAFAGFV